MKKYGKLAALAAALILVIGLAAVAYNKLKEEAELPSLTGELEDSAKGDTKAPEQESAEEEDSKEELEKDDTTDGEATEDTEEDPGEGRQNAIDVTFYDSEGKAVKLSDFYGKPVVMNFWATWCGYCKQEMPDFQEAYEEYGEEVEFLFINSTDGSRETREKAAAYLEEQGYTVPAFYDEDLEAVYTYSVNSLPTTILLDKKGRVAAYAPGLMEKDTLVGALDILLEE